MFWFLLNALVVIFFAWLVTKKYGTLLNPIGFLGGFYLMIATIAPILFQSLGLLSKSSESAIAYTSILSSVFFIAIGMAFAMRSSPFKAIFRRLLLFIRPFELTDQGNGLVTAALLLQVAILFIALMIASHSGFMWITNPRLAYTRRDSVGSIWSTCEVTLFLTYTCVIFRKAKTVKSLYGYALLFACLAWFLASKGQMLTYFVLALFYQHVRIKPVRNKMIVIAGVLVLCVQLVLQIYQGTAKDLMGALTYFDYFSNTTMLIDRFKGFGFRYGAVTLSNLWLFVPRGLYHAKPYVYAGAIADEYLFPGGAADGYTAGMMPWVQSYCDIGLAGVIVYGLFIGFLAKGVYELFLERPSIQSFMLLGQIGLIYCIEIYAPAPFVIFMAWLIVQTGLIRILSSIRPLPGIRKISTADSG